MGWGNRASQHGLAHGSHLGAAARLLRRRGPGHRDRRAGARQYGAPVYVRHEIVHNRHVVESLKAKGARFVEDLSEVPPGAVTIFSAHGVSRAVEADAEARGLPVLDATCPLVAKVHHEGQRYVDQGRIVILIGHAGHPEVEGTMGQIKGAVHLVQSEEDVERLDDRRAMRRSPTSPRRR